MAQHITPISFEEISFDDARPIGRGLHIVSDLDNARKKKLQSLGNVAAHMTLAKGTRPTVMRLMKTLVSPLKVTFTIVSFTAGTIMPLSAADEIKLDLMASKVSTINGEFTGHALRCLALC
jgi:hypothetical protein